MRFDPDVDAMALIWIKSGHPFLSETVVEEICALVAVPKHQDRIAPKFPVEPLQGGPPEGG